jgi:hypothetical protein
MTFSEIPTLRTRNQHITNSKFTTVKELVSEMGAMQAQDLAMAKWAAGLRVQNATEKSIESAYNNGEIIRTHLMRPTWHLVSSDDIYWLLELTAPRIKPQLKSRNNHLELTEDVYRNCNDILERALSTTLFLSREDLVQFFEKEGIRTSDNRLSHILMNAELDGIICSGPLKNNKLTYSLLSQRVPVKKLRSKDEALAELAKRYFSSHGPATLQDFAWWSGLSVSDSRKALEMNKETLNSERISHETYWFSNSLQDSEKEHIVRLLPAFDELLISYRDRSAIITDTDNKKAISSNGIFRPIIVVDGQTIGIWRRLTTKNHTLIEASLFKVQDKHIIDSIENEANRYSAFIGKPIRFTINQYSE